MAMAWLNPEWKGHDKKHEFKKHKIEQAEVHEVPDTGTNILLLTMALGTLLVFKFKTAQ